MGRSGSGVTETHFGMIFKEKDWRGEGENTRRGEGRGKRSMNRPSKITAF